ncbi:diguanylate cyclase domain-containing protein [Methylobacter svalbardensis]|uniref:diguanylate cyclase domain-containing protein n=1 Tax=Methylobacter svalbardensis TaxID=3080016 RepID=UPI0030EDB00E
MIERIREELGITTLAFHGSKPIPVTVSFGLAMLDPDINVEETIHRADTALYAAKTAGRNCSCIWCTANATHMVKD